MAELDAIEASLKQARDAEQERAAISEMNRKCMDLKLSPVVTAYDSTGAQIPISEWDKHRNRLKDARVQITLTLRNRLTRTVNHTLIDAANFPYLLFGE
ncbi:MAG: hypothetical protein IPK87_06170 [Planctomycetes bacterium]|nr:hypothetical protein [Planctomycetota bacterium]